MTGLEGVAAGASAAVASAAKKVVTDDPRVDGMLLDIAKDNGALDRAAEARAHRAEVLEVVKYRLTQPLAWLFRANSYFDGQFQEEVTARLKDVPEDQIATPPTSIAAPILEGISHTIDEPSLRDLYLNLLAAASDKRSTDSTHPAFAHVIDQLRSDEAGALSAILDRPNGLTSTPAARIVVRDSVADPETHDGLDLKFIDTRPYRVVVDCITNLSWHGDTHSDELTERLGVYYANWQRLGLVEIDFSRWHSDESAFAWVSDHPLYRKALREKEAGHDISFEKGILWFTPFGREFARTVLPETSCIDGEVTEHQPTETHEHTNM